MCLFIYYSILRTFFIPLADWTESLCYFCTEFKANKDYLDSDSELVASFGSRAWSIIINMKLSDLDF